MSENLKYLTPELFLVIFNLSFLCVMLFVKSSAILPNCNKIAALALIITAVLVHFNHVNANPIINGFYTSNEFTAFFKMLILFLSSVILYLSDAYLKKNGLLKYEFPILINFSVFGKFHPCCAIIVNNVYNAFSVVQQKLCAGSCA